MNDSVEKLIQIGFSQIRESLTQLVTVSKVMGMERLVVSIEDDEDVLETPLEDVIEAIRIAIDFEQRRKLPNIP